MNKEDILRYAGWRNGTICIDIQFDKDVIAVRATLIQYYRGKWSINLEYLPYLKDINLDTLEGGALVTGDYNSSEEIIEYLTEYLGISTEEWKNYTRDGLFIDLTEEEESLYKNNPFNKWKPERIIVPKGSNFTIITPDEWNRETKIVTH